MVLRQVGVELLAYDGARASDLAGPFADAARRVRDDPGLSHPLRPAGVSATGIDVAGLLQEVADHCARRPAAIFGIRIRDTRDTR